MTSGHVFEDEAAVFRSRGIEVIPDDHLWSAPAWCWALSLPFDRSTNRATKLEKALDAVLQIDSAVEALKAIVSSFGVRGSVEIEKSVKLYLLSIGVTP